MSNTARNNGIGIATIVALAFVILKLCHVIDWSWLWVLAPIWIPFALGVAYLAIIGVGALLWWLVRRWLGAYKRPVDRKAATK